MYTSSESKVLHTGAWLGESLPIQFINTAQVGSGFTRLHFGQGDVGSDVKYNKLCKHFSCESGLLHLLKQLVHLYCTCM